MNIRLRLESESPERTVYCTQPAGLPHCVASGRGLLTRVAVVVAFTRVLVGAFVAVDGAVGVAITAVLVASLLSGTTPIGLTVDVCVRLFSIIVAEPVNPS